MSTTDIDVTTKAGRRTLSSVEAAIEAGTAGKYEIPCDENGNPIGTPWEVIRERMYDKLSTHYGVDLRTL